MTREKWIGRVATFGLSTIFLGTPLGGCKQQRSPGALESQPAPTPPGAQSQPDELELSQGPALPLLPDAGPPSPLHELHPYLQPAGAVAILAQSVDDRLNGSVHFSDTVAGTRVIASIQGLEPGVYELRVDEFFYGPHDGMTCKAAKYIQKKRQPVTWRIGPLRPGADGVVRFDRVYPGISVLQGAYRVPARPVNRPNEPQMAIQLREFSLARRKLTLHKRSSSREKATGDALACGIIEDAPPFGTAIIAPLAGNAVKGVISFQQGEDNRALLEVKLTNLTPGPYRLVVHEFADCSNATGAGVGEPYHPEDNPVVTQPDYGWPLKKGDLGTFTADESGTIVDEKLFEHPLTSGSPHTIRGRAIVVESRAPDATSGKPRRVGCGIVTGF
jgi:Cu/Zn superoxide dismutase